jgi:hypothetical protein
MVQRDCLYGVQVACNVKSMDMHAMRSIWCLCLSGQVGGVGFGHCFVHFMVIWGLEKHSKTSSALIKLIWKCGGSKCCCYWRFLLLQLAQEWS